MTTDTPPRTCPNCACPLPTLPDPYERPTQSNVWTERVGQVIGIVVIVAVSAAIVTALVLGLIGLARSVL